MALKADYLLARFNVPKSTRHVTRAGHNLVVVDEATARQVARVAGQLAAHSHVSFARLQAVYGTYVVETSACDETARWRVRTSHNPTRTQRNGMHFIRRERVPNDELAVL